MNEAAHFLNSSELRHGNFLDLLIILSKFDPVINYYIEHQRPVSWPVTGWSILGLLVGLLADVWSV